MDGHNVGMTQSDKGLTFTGQPCQKVWFGTLQIAMKDLHSYITVESQVSRFPYFTNASSPQIMQQLVLAQAAWSCAQGILLYPDYIRINPNIP
jgi:hypothetical protein